MSLLKRIERARPGGEGEPQVPAAPQTTPVPSSGGQPAPPPSGPAGAGTTSRPFLGAMPARESFREAKYRVQNRLINELDPKLDLSNQVEVRRQIEELFGRIADEEGLALTRAERVRMLRFHGSRDKTTFELVGTNSRLDAVQAAMLRVFLPHLTGWNATRREAAARYAELGLGEAVELPVDEPGHVYHMYVVRSTRRGEIAIALGEAGIASASYYVTPMHLQPALAYLGYERGPLPETERMAVENLALPMWGSIGADVQERVVDAVRSAVGVPA